MNLETVKTSVIVPTYRRPDDLIRCLRSVAQSTRPPHEVIVVIRDIDTETAKRLDECAPENLPVVRVVVDKPGQVAALNAAIDAAVGDILAITDDDAAPSPEWVERIEAHFAADPEVGAVGGRDRVHHGSHGVEEGASHTVGKVAWYGRTIGAHHIGVGPARRVSFLKGANMSFRRSAVDELRFDTRLLGKGAQVHNDLAFCLALGRTGWKLIYDPAVLVEHYEAPRFDLDGRAQYNSEAQFNRVHNETLTLLEYLDGPRRFAYLTMMLLIGTRAEPGVLQAVRIALRGDADAAVKWRKTLAGRIAGIRAYHRSKRSKLR